MNISDNIKWILESDKWELYKNKSYTAMIQTADSTRIYNVPNQPGTVYNILEDSFEKVGGAAAVVRGLAGEMWPIGQSALKKYRIAPENITDVEQPVDTEETDTVFAGIQIPAETVFELEVNYGETAILKGNRPDIGHGSGDYVLAAAKLVDGKYLPDFDDSGRIVNGEIFDKLYQPIKK